MAASSVGSETEFVTSNLYKCSKCVFTTSSVEEIKTHIASCNASTLSEVNDIAETSNATAALTGDDSVSKVSLVLYEDTRPASGVFQWPEEAVLEFIKYLKHERQQEPRETQFKALNYARVVKRMRDKGWDVSASQCEYKYRNMKRTFLKLFGKRKRGIQSRRDWRFYEPMSDLVKPWLEKCEVPTNSSAKSGRDGFYSSSLQLEESSSDANSNSDVGEMPNPKRMKLTQDQPKWFLDFRKECERRHQQRQQVATRLTGLLEKFIERVNCKCYKRWK